MVDDEAFYAAQPAPRIRPLAPSELTDDLLALIRRMMTVGGAIDARQKNIFDGLVAPDADRSDPAYQAQLAALPEYLLTILRHPDLFGRIVDVGIQLLARGVLPPRDRELAVLRIGWLCNAPYEWGEHVLVAKKCGISSEEIERLTQGADAPGWSEHDRAVIRATEELHATATITDATWATLAKTYDDRQLMELPVVVGQYQGVAYVQNALHMRLHRGNEGLAAR